ncbi:hypothetical protein, partial [uncultured Marinobacter sp.]|uniref:hypothetical protein n=1 Tax=uncultured Marinobacter sp. TaxID=187379 RepID=UPI0030D869B5
SYLLLISFLSPSYLLLISLETGVKITALSHLQIMLCPSVHYYWWQVRLYNTLPKGYRWARQ